jgi:hypothetical protein
MACWVFIWQEGTTLEEAMRFADEMNNRVPALTLTNIKGAGPKPHSRGFAPAVHSVIHIL